MARLDFQSPDALRRVAIGIQWLCVAGLLAAASPSPEIRATAVMPLATSEQRIHYERVAAKSIIDLQRFRRTHSIAVPDPGGREGTATLIEVNPNVNAWFLLTLDRAPASAALTYHLENPNPQGQTVRLAERGLVITDGGTDHSCALWAKKPTALDQARTSGLPFARLCEGRLYLRNSVAGRQTDLEKVTDFLRDHVWGGEAVIRVVHRGMFRDAYVEAGGSAPDAAAGTLPLGAPPPALVDRAYAERAIMPENLGIEMTGTRAGAVILGQWYAASGLAGVYVSVMEPRSVDREILSSYPRRAKPLDSVEGAALVYLLAFDLGNYDVGYAVGSVHPRLAWSTRPPGVMRPAGLPGPDGVDKLAPLVATGMVSPAVAGRAVATFTGGFKRQHGAFRWGDLAERNYGSHYGFVEQGAILSKLQPGLATLYRLADGTISMKTWSADDDRSLNRVVFARQNGVPLVEPDSATLRSAPGLLVRHWGPGNWSGSAKKELRALRAGACLVEANGQRFLLYGYFSTATPSAMARVFQAYGCRYAMQLDMNALEHTYLAAYQRQGDSVVVEHLVKGMAQVDKVGGGGLVPRFLGFPDNRDFFYVFRREADR